MPSCRLANVWTGQLEDVEASCYYKLTTLLKQENIHHRTFNYFQETFNSLLKYNICKLT